MDYFVKNEIIGQFERCFFFFYKMSEFFVRVLRLYVNFKNEKKKNCSYIIMIYIID